jgi:DegV family protein with EDD domain
MANKIKILADSTCDLSPELIEKYGVVINPLIVNLGDTSYRDQLNLFPRELFEYVKTTGQLPKTAANSPIDYVEAFKPYVDEGYDVIYLGISSELSAAYASMLIAAEELGHVYYVDSRNLSTGISLLVIKAAEMIEQGMSAPDIIKFLQPMVEKVDTSFVLDTLTFLWKGGRCSGVAALGANLLNLKPCIEVKDGKMGVGKKYRGNLLASIEQYVADRLKGASDLDLSRIFITNSTGFTAEELERVKKKVLEFQKFEEVHMTEAGCSVCCHCGPRTLGILFMHK